MHTALFADYGAAPTGELLESSSFSSLGESRLPVRRPTVQALREPRFVERLRMDGCSRIRLPTTLAAILAGGSASPDRGGRHQRRTPLLLRNGPLLRIEDTDEHSEQKRLSFRPRG
jgi:hypothetical protein